MEMEVETEMEMEMGMGMEMEASLSYLRNSLDTSKGRAGAGRSYRRSGWAQYGATWSYLVIGWSSEAKCGMVSGDPKASWEL